MANFLNAQDVAYDNPGSVARYYGWNKDNINDVISGRVGKGTSNARNVQSHIDKFLGKRGVDMKSARPGHLIAAMDYAYREEGRKQQTKGGGFLNFLKKFIGPVAGSLILPGVGSALGAGISAGVGGAIGGAIQGGISDGPLGALTGAASGYGIGSGVGAVQNWASGLGGSAGGFTNPSGLGFSGNNLALPGLANAPASTAAGGFGASSLGLSGGNLGLNFLSGNFAANPIQGYGPSAVGGDPASLYNPQSMGGPAPFGGRIPSIGMPTGGPGAQQQTGQPSPMQTDQGTGQLPTPGAAPTQSAGGTSFDATLMAAGKMPNNVLAMMGMGSGKMGLSDRDRMRLPGYQTRPVANFLMGYQ